MECSDDTDIHKYMESCDMEDKVQSNKEPLQHNEILIELQEPPESHKNVEIVPKKSELIICDNINIKQEPWYMNETTADIKSELQEPPISSFEPCINAIVIKREDDIKMRIKEDPLWLDTSLTEVRGISTDTAQNQEKENVECTDGSLDILPSIGSRLQSELVSAACFINSSNTEKDIFRNNDPADPKVLQDFSSIQHEKFEESKATDSNVQEHSYDTAYQCEICENSFKTLSELNEHTESHKGENLFKCENCDKSFTVAWNLRRHQLIHTGERPFACEICSKTYTQMGHLKQHKLTHGDERPYSCEICSKTFTHSGNLRKHQVVHDGKRPYSCDICNKTYTRASHLKEHKLIHEGKKPHTCGICNRSFIHVSNLYTHQITHEGKRPYACDLCNKSFTKAHHVKQHKLITHEGKRPYTCNLCNQSFTKAENVKRHKLTTHEGKRPYSCDLCTKTFTQSPQLKKHKLRCIGDSHKPQTTDVS